MADLVDRLIEREKRARGQDRILLQAALTAVRQRDALLARLKTAHSLVKDAHDTNSGDPNHSILVAASLEAAVREMAAGIAQAEGR